MFNPETAPYAKLFLREIKAARPPSAGELIVSPVQHESDIERVILAAGRQAPSGLIVLPDSFLVRYRRLIAELAAQSRLPAVYPIAEFTSVGGLIAYGFDRVDLFRRAASYVHRILRGENPSDLPVQHPTKFQLVINLKTAKALGLAIPPTLLARADDVIE
jgi:putative ABC transport system substrate-binding protein